MKRRDVRLLQKRRLQSNGGFESWQHRLDLLGVNFQVRDGVAHLWRILDGGLSTLRKVSGVDKKKCELERDTYAFSPSYQAGLQKLARKMHSMSAAT